uniref:Uncharacterized protein n=1 Tax=Avena sativa TaxID=4498 RepID=A0ACD5ZL48_AVESA
MLKEARKQSGVGWCEKSCRIQADDALWDNLLISFPKIGKFKKYDFPLFDRLGDLYDDNSTYVHWQIAEGTYNFTSISEPSQIDEENEEVQNANTNDDDDLQIVDGGGPAHLGAEVNPVIDVDAAEKDELTNEGGPSIVPKKKPTNGGGPAIVPKKKPTNELNKPNKSDVMVAVVDRYVKMKEKQAEEEKAESNVFTISKCISAVQNMNELSRVERVKVSKVFKIAENRETFLTWAAQDEESAIMWLRGELQELP